MAMAPLPQPKECELYELSSAHDSEHSEFLKDTWEMAPRTLQKSNHAKRKPHVYDFLAVFAVLLAFTTWVESNAGSLATDEHSISDVGFWLTSSLHDRLSHDRILNDWLALINSLILLIPLAYSFLVTTLTGDYELIFRIVCAQVLRSICGFLTHIPPDAHYLASNYDYPDIIHCLWDDCSGEPQVMPFISFYSGHVANLVICGNDLWLRFGNRNANAGNLSRGHMAAIAVHALNVFQIIRMLATRGHYTIDILMGWVVAVYATSGAGRLGRAYTNQGVSLRSLMPRSLDQLWDLYTGIGEWRVDQQQCASELCQPHCYITTTSTNNNNNMNSSSHSSRQEEMMLRLNLARRPAPNDEDAATETTCALSYRSSQSDCSSSNDS